MIVKGLKEKCAVSFACWKEARVRLAGEISPGDRHIYLTKYIHDSITHPTKSQAHYVRALTSPIVISDNAFSRRLEVLAAKRVVPPVLEFFHSFFAEEEREEHETEVEVVDDEDGGGGGKGGGYDRQRDDIKNHNASILT